MALLDNSIITVQKSVDSQEESTILNEKSFIKYIDQNFGAQAQVKVIDQKSKTNGNNKMNKNIA